MNSDIITPPAAEPGVPQPISPVPQTDLRLESLGNQSLLSDSQMAEIAPITVAVPAQAPVQPAAFVQPQPAPVMPTVNNPVGVGSFQPIAPLQPMPQQRSKKKLFIILGVLLGLITIGALLVVFVFRTSIIGSLSSDTFEGATYQRPSGWEKDTSQSDIVVYHPKSALTKTSSGEPAYAIKMQISAQKGQFGVKPSEMKASDKAALANYIDKEISKASTEILPSKYDVGCNDDPTYMDNPVKANITNAFLDIKYSFVCKATAGKNSQTFYFKVIDVVPNDKDVEYVIVIGAASREIYNTNLPKIDKILDSISF